MALRGRFAAAETAASACGVPVRRAGAAWAGTAASHRGAARPSTPAAIEPKVEAPSPSQRGETAKRRKTFRHFAVSLSSERAIFLRSFGVVRWPRLRGPRRARLVRWPRLLPGPVPPPMPGPRRRPRQRRPRSPRAGRPTGTRSHRGQDSQKLTLLQVKSTLTGKTNTIGKRVRN